MHFSPTIPTLILITFLSFATADYVVSPGYSARTLTYIPGARSVLILPESEHILVLSTLDSRIVAIVETPGDNETTIIEQFIIVSGSEWGLPSETLNHGLAYASGHIYASSIDTVYRWPYTPGSLETVTVPPTRVVVHIPDNGHWTRTIIFDSEELLYVAVGSEEFFEVDQDSERARIRRFNISRVPIQGIDFEEGEVSHKS